jgi:chemotaxis protein methyltransferase CheR
MAEIMMPDITKQEFLLFRDFIEKHCGIHLGPDKAYLVQHRLARLAEGCGCSCYADLFDLALKEKECGRLCGQIIDAITTNETSWFRDPRQFEALLGQLLLDTWKKGKDGRRNNLEIWSAACSTGQEPYTIAMVATDFCETVVREKECRSKVRVLATDISEASIQKAISGIYEEADMKRGLDEKRIDRYFFRDGTKWRIREDLRQMVVFKRFNLKNDFKGLGTFDIVFLRNVIIYFSDGLKKEIFQRVAKRLHPGGLLFLGTGETVSAHSQAFTVEECGDATYYRLK